MRLRYSGVGKKKHSAVGPWQSLANKGAAIGSDDWGA